MTGQPLAVGTAVAALLALNGDDTPYELSADPLAPGASSDRTTVKAFWKVWDVRWHGVFANSGRDVATYRLEVQLDGSSGTYRFVEKLADEISSGTGLGGSSKSAFRGKTWGHHETKVVRARDVTVTDAQGHGTTENVTTGRIFGHEREVFRQTFRPADLKDPVFDTLRDLGWLPPHESRWARLWER